MTLYFVQADYEGTGDSLDLFVRKDDGGVYDSAAVLRDWRDYYNSGETGEDAMISDNVFPTRVFKVSDSETGALRWNDPSGCDVVEEFDI